MNEQTSRLTIVLVGVAAFVVTALIAVKVINRETDPTADGVESYIEPIDKSWPAPQFALMDQDGQPFGSQQLAGKVYIIDFIFTDCPGPCPAMTAAMAQLQKKLDADEKFKDVMLVSVSLDPETDTPQRLTEYANMNGADGNRWKFLTGDREKIWTVVREGFKQPVAYAEGEGSKAHRIVHSQHFMPVDRAGNIRGWFRGIDDVTLGPDELDALMQKVQTILGEE